MTSVASNRELTNISNMDSQSGSGRETTKRPINMMVGRRTGVQMKQNVKQNAQGFDDIDDFWGDDDVETKPTSRTFIAPKPISPQTTTPGFSGNSMQSPPPVASPSPFFTPGSDVSSVGGRMTSPAVDSPSNTYVEDDSIPPMENDYDDTMMSSEEEEPLTPEPTPKPVKRRKKKKKNKNKTNKKRVSKKAQKIMQKKRKRVLETPIPSKGRPDPIPNMTAEKELAIAKGLRRSKRQRWKPLAYWKNERIGFEVLPGQTEPTVIGAIRDGCPTPLLKKSDRTPQAKTPHYLKKKGRKKKKRRKKVQSDSDSEDEIQESPVKLPRGFEVNEGMYVNFKVENPQTSKMEVKKMQAVGRGASCAFRNLPTTGDIEPQACGALDNDRVVSGILRLQPGASKDLEGVHKCTQVFYVTKAQDESLEFQVGRKSLSGNLPFLLSKGDHFYVQPHNSYSMYNHSRSKMAEVHFLVVKPSGDFE
eukprot:g758.t1